MTAGDQLWVDQNARAELHVGSTAIRLGAETSAAFLALNDQALQLRLNQGSAQLRVRAIYEGQHVEVATPDLAFVIEEPGSYRIDVDPAHQTTRVTVWQGSGTAVGAASNSYRLRAGDRVIYIGQDLAQQALNRVRRSTGLISGPSNATNAKRRRPRRVMSRVS